jgi:hypothetical protein
MQLSSPVLEASQHVCMHVFSRNIFATKPMCVAVSFGGWRDGVSHRTSDGRKGHPHAHVRAVSVKQHIGGDKLLPD